ncbi:MAG: nucleotide exchange factor GrpE [Paracoccaceae bacterium]
MSDEHDKKTEGPLPGGASTGPSAPGPATPMDEPAASTEEAPEGADAMTGADSATSPPASGDAEGTDASPSVEDLIDGLGAMPETAARLEEIEAERDRLQAERDEMEKNWKYAAAEVQNVRRRAERDVEAAGVKAAARLARDLLSVYDNLDRALGLADEALRAEHANFVEGIELTRRELLNAFAKHRIEQHVPEKGKKFDPNFEQAMFEAPVSGAEPGTVIEVMQPGFTIAGRILRPALVGVAKAEPQAAKG